MKKSDNLNTFGSRVNPESIMKEEIKIRLATENKAYCANKKLLTSKLLSKQSKFKIYNLILIRPVVTYGCETWTSRKSDKEKLKRFERMILWKISGSTQEPDGSWRIKTNDEIEQIMHEQIIQCTNVVRFIKVQKLSWLGHFECMKHNKNTRGITWQGSLSSRPIRRSRLRWYDQVIEDLRKIQIRNWKQETKDRKVRSQIIKRAKIHHGL